MSPGGQERGRGRNRGENLWIDGEQKQEKDPDQAHHGREPDDDVIPRHHVLGPTLILCHTPQRSPCVSHRRRPSHAPHGRANGEVRSDCDGRIDAEPLPSSVRPERTYNEHAAHLSIGRSCRPVNETHGLPCSFHRGRQQGTGAYIHLEQCGDRAEVHSYARQCCRHVKMLSRWSSPASGRRRGRRRTCGAVCRDANRRDTPLRDEYGGRV
jgi:hypothetical protein